MENLDRTPEEFDGDAAGSSDSPRARRESTSNEDSTPAESTSESSAESGADDVAKPKKRRRGSRGGRGRTSTAKKKKTTKAAAAEVEEADEPPEAVAEAPVEPTVVAPAPPAPVVKAPPARVARPSPFSPGPPLDQYAEPAPRREAPRASQAPKAPESPAPLAQQPSETPPATSGGPTPPPPPPRVGPPMGGYRIPSPTGFGSAGSRISFGKGKQRHQFRPSGQVPRVPGQTGQPGQPVEMTAAEIAAQQAADEALIEREYQEYLAQQNEAKQPGGQTPPVRMPPQKQAANPGNQRDGNQRDDVQRNPGNQRNEPRSNQQGQQQRPPQGGGRGQQQRGGQQNNRQQGQRNDQRGRQQPQGRQGPQQQGRPQNQPQRGGPVEQRPAFRPVEQEYAAPVEQELPQEIVPQPIVQPPVQRAEPRPVANPNVPGFAGPTVIEPMAPATAADSAALAPFAEDIEIEEEPQVPLKRREPTGREMLINVVEGEEVRIAVVKRGQLEELYMERSSTESHVGNIYKGRVTNVEPSIQAAFVDFGIGKNGFLHISDVHPQYFPKQYQPRPRQRPQNRPLPVQPIVRAAEQPSAEQMESGQIAAEQAMEQVTEQTPQDTQMYSGSGESSPGLESTLPPPDESSEGMLAQSSGEEMPVVQRVAEEPGTELDSEQDSEPEDDLGDEPHENHPAEPTGPVMEQAGVYTGADEGREEYEEDWEVDDGHMQPMERVGRKTPRHERPPIQQALRRGQEVIVQVTKEGIGTKGPTLTSYISCPGRYLVMMPGMSHLGVSRKIEDEQQRRELRKILDELNPPRNLGFIIRTAGVDVAKRELQGDLNYLVRMWKVIANRIRTNRAPVELYQESDLVIRTIRDVFNDEIDRIVVDNEQVASRIRDFLSIVNPRSAGAVELYTGTMPIFQKYNVEREIEKIHARRVELPNGGSLVIDSTEALVAIDINSGRYREMRDAELTAFNMNKEAVKEVVRQLRLRDLGGVVVIDFIDMREERHKREIERLLRDYLKDDRAKTKVLRMSQFCMVELTRQRVRPSLKRSIYMDCPHCKGSALIKTPESVSLDVMRRIAAGATRNDVVRLEVRVYPTVATYLLNRKRKALVDLEDKTGKRINIHADRELGGDGIIIEGVDLRGSVLNIPL